MSEDEPLADHPVIRTSDVVRAVDALQRVLPRIPIRLRVNTGRTLRMLMNAAEVGSVTASYLRFGTDVHMVSGETDSYYVNLPLRGRALWRAEKLAVLSTPSRAAVLNPGIRGNIVWDADCSLLSVMVPRANVHRELERLLGRVVPQPPRFDPAMDLAAPVARSWLDTMRLVHRQLEHGEAGLLAHPLAAQTFENLVVGGLLLAHRHDHSEALARPARPATPGTARNAIELLEAHPERGWSVGALAQEVHVSVRTLQQTFNRSVGVSPMRYLRQVRLARVHAELLAATPDSVTVTEVAARWGFLHHGHFARAYRERYGRGPADTLRSEH